MAGPAAPTVLTLSYVYDFEGVPSGYSTEASVTTDSPFGMALRSGNAKSGDTSAGIKALLAPGVTVESVAFSYRQITGYAKTGPGPNFTLSVAGTAAFRSAPLDHDHPYPPKGTGCPDGACYAPAVPASAAGLGIKVPAAGPQRIVFDFHNTATNLQLLLPMNITISCGDDPCMVPPPPPSGPANVVWNVVWVGGQSNSVGSNSQTSGYPTWPTSDLIQMFDWGGKAKGKFAPASVPVYGESNVGFSQTFANLLLPTLPAGHGVIIVNNGVGGTGFHDGHWDVPNGPLTTNADAAMAALAAGVTKQFQNGTYKLHAMLWHQGEEDAADNHDNYHASYCTYLESDLGKLIDHFREGFPGGTAGTPFIDGGMLPYWVDKVNGTSGVMEAIYALNTSRPCTGTADSRIFPDYFPGTQKPCGEPGHRSGFSGDVIHFNATQATMMGHQYFRAYQQAIKLTTVVPSARTKACSNRGAALAPAVTQCGS